jgi:predicted outer membrane repeat protein
MRFPLAASRRRIAIPVRSHGHTHRRRRLWTPEGLESRLLLSGNPTYYTVNLTSDTGASSGTDATTGYPSGDLLWALTQANNNTAGSVINFDSTVFASPQTITLSSTLVLSESGGPEVIQGPGGSLLTISGEDAGTAFVVEPYVSAILSGLTITGCSSSGIQNLQGYVTVLDSTFINNSSGDNGGGIDNVNGGALWVSDSKFISNSSAFGGGAIFGGTVTVDTSSFSGNISSEGGAIYGGATVTNSTFSANSASGSGGAIFCADCALTVANSTLAGNSAATSGGGIYVSGSVFGFQNTLTNVTITANRCNTVGSGGQGGGILAEQDSSVLLNNTIVAANLNAPPSSNSPDDVAGVMSEDSAFNLIGTQGGGGVDPINSGNQVGVSDPGLGPLGDYGGPTQTVPLLAGSPAIGAGRQSLAVDPNTGLPFTSDQRGQGFPRFYNDSVDIGAFESQLAPPKMTLTVTNTSDSGPGSLRDCLRANDLHGGDNPIVFDIPTTDPGYDPTTGSFTITLTSDGLSSIQDLILNGPGASSLVINGNHAHRVLETAPFEVASISGITLENGILGPQGYGGGIWNNRGTLTVNDCTFSDNGDSAGYGGGIGNEGSLTVTGCSFSGNSAGYGGGIENEGSLTVADCSFSGNSAGDSGGGIESVGSLTVGDSVFTGNNAAAGGGIAAYDLRIELQTINDCTFSGNSAKYAGGGISAYSPIISEVQVTNSTFSDNSAGAQGGGIGQVASQGLLQLVASNCTFTVNSSGGDGGGINLFRAAAYLTNDTITDNSAAVGGGVFCGPGTFYVINSIVAGNTASSTAPDSFAFIWSRGHNLIGNASGRGSHFVASDLVGTADNPIDPLLAPLGDYGGPTQTMPPRPGSPAIDAGDDSVLASPYNLTTDQRGAGYPRQFGSHVDIGAYEVGPSYLIGASTAPSVVQALVNAAAASTGSVTLQLQASSDAVVSTVIHAVNSVTPSVPLLTVTLDLGGGTYTTDTKVNTQSGVTLIIQNGTLIGGSPALVVDAGSVVLNQVTALNATNAPTILVNGGSLEVRRSTIQESTAFAQAALLVNGGTVDLGTAADPGGNVFNVNGAGTLIQNETGNPVSAVGDTFENNGTSAPSIFVLNPAANGALTLSGNASIVIPGAVVVDSSSKTALSVGGNAKLSAWATGVSVPDPLVGLASPSPTGLSNYGAFGLTGNTSQTITPGIYSQITVSGSARLTLNPGIYIIEGGDLTVTGNASISGTGVTIYNAGSNYPNSGGNFGGITLSGNGMFNLSAPTTGAYAGILIFQSRQNTRALSLSGNATAGMSGTIYAANALLSMSGSASLISPLIVGMLNLSGNVALTQMAGGSDGIGDTSGVANTLVAGNLSIYISDPSGLFTSDELARIQDAINAWDAILVPYNVAITEVSDPTVANIVIDTSTTSACGGMADGVLGCYNEPQSEITMVQGWNWYAGADPAQISSGQYDFETTVLHELGHALGLGGSTDPTSPMCETLAAGVGLRTVTTQDLNIPEPPEGADPQMAAGFHLGSAAVGTAQNSFVPAVAQGVNGSGSWSLVVGSLAVAIGQWSVVSGSSPFATSPASVVSGQLSPISSQTIIVAGPQVSVVAQGSAEGSEQGQEPVIHDFDGAGEIDDTVWTLAGRRLRSDRAIDRALNELASEIVLTQAWDAAGLFASPIVPPYDAGTPEPMQRATPVGSDVSRPIPAWADMTPQTEPAQPPPFAARLTAILLAAGWWGRGLTRSNCKPISNKRLILTAARGEV